jgi:hypothetical protein
VVRVSGEAFGGAAWCGFPESPPRGAALCRVSGEPAGGAALPPRCRRGARVYCGEPEGVGEKEEHISSGGMFYVL